VQLTTDPDPTVRAAAAACPGLPPETLSALLARQDTAKAAALVGWSVSTLK
jgi:hypothetical protein